jgi:hypothetical protein
MEFMKIGHVCLSFSQGRFVIVQSASGLKWLSLACVTLHVIGYTPHCALYLQMSQLPPDCNYIR